MVLNHVSQTEILQALAFALLLGITVPKLAAFEGGFEWATVPLWMLMVVYSSSVLKALSPKEHKDRLEQVIVLALMSYFVMRIVWPFEMTWYEALVVCSLFVRGQFLGYTLMSTYYVLSAVSAMKHAAPVEATARVLLFLLFANLAYESRPNDQPDPETT